MKTCRGGVANDRGGETGRAAALAGGVDANGGDLLDELEHLTLCGTGVTEEKDVDVTTQFHAIWEDLAGPAEEEAGHGPLNIVKAKDGGRDAGGELLVDLGVPGEREHLFFLLFREGGLAAPPGAEVVKQHTHDAEVRLSEGDSSPIPGLLAAPVAEDGVNSHQRDPGPGDGNPSEVAVVCGKKRELAKYE